MFDKLKQLAQIRDLQAKLSREKVEVEKQGVKMIINGKMEVEEVVLNSALSKEEQETAVRECFNDGMKKIQTLAAKQMFQI